MTTYTIQGIRVDVEDRDPVSVSTTELTVVVPDNSAGFSYKYLGLDDGAPMVEIEDDLIFGSIGGVPLDQLNGGEIDALMARVTWSGGVTTILGLEWESGNNSDVLTYYVLDGTPLPSNLSSGADWEAFDASIQDIKLPSGIFASDTNIAWTEFDNVSSTEDDEMGGTDGNDTLNGGIGDDYFVSSKGADTYNGGAGWDQVAFHIDDPAGVYANLKTGLAVDGWGFSDTLNSIEMLRGSMYDDELIGSDGNDIMRGVKGRDDMDGGKGKHDEVRYDRDERYGGTDGVKVNLKKGFAIDGFGDRDKLSNFEDVRGTIYKDKLIGSNAKNEIEAGDGNDVIKGLGGRDKIYGGIGRDKIDGGKGKDNLWGDRGADKFIFKGKFGNDKIKDFETDNKGEKIVLKKIGAIESFDDLMNNHISDVNGSAVIEDGNGNSITIDGITMSELAANDFLF
ncbi:MAG: calcium-binding protein [Heliomarina sp.]|uniref:calcium-binding protein n=1 Tax=Heliomarina sp. TaxID=2917556 RepID=UPI00405A3634